MKTIVIEYQDGVVQMAYADEPVQVIIIDHDVYGARSEDVRVINNEQVYVDEIPVKPSEVIIEEAIKALGDKQDDQD